MGKRRGTFFGSGSVNLPLVLGLLLSAAGVSAAKVAGETDPGAPRFLRCYWYERGIEHGNPFFNSRFRVNAPEAVLDPPYMHRSEVRENGMMQILIDENLAQLAGAELSLEIWGGHPGTTNKRVTPNGRTTYMLPRVGTEEKNCTHDYPVIALKITDLVNGYNAFQFACDQGETFWGHFIVGNACLRVVLKDDHPHLEKAGLGGFRASVAAAPSGAQGEAIDLALDVPAESLDAVASVDYLGLYDGYDENGNTRRRDWHGFTKQRRPAAIVAAAVEAPFRATWDVSMLPDQKDMAVRAIVHFKDHPKMLYETAPTRGLATPDRKGSAVFLRGSSDLPRAFWSRDSREARCSIVLDKDPDRIERAQLHVVIWDGGAGAVAEPFTLNGHALAVAGQGRHDVLYRVVDVAPRQLRRGANEIRLLSDTKHHGIEVLLPGPALMLRAK